MFAVCFCEGIVLSFAMAVCDFGIWEFDVMLLINWKTILLLSFWLRLFAKLVQFCFCCSFIGDLICDLVTMYLK